MEQPPPVVSVLFPVYNAAESVGTALQSIQAQTLETWELLAVDDGSTDRTLAILREAAATDSRIRIIEQAHSGVVKAHNLALEQARGSFVARMDADDVAHPDRLARQVAHLEAHPELDLVGCQVDFGGDRRAARGFQLHVDWINSVLSAEDHQAAQFLEFPLANPTLCGRREAWLRVGKTREGPFPEDYEWFLRAMETGLQIAKVPEVLLKWNDPPTRLTRSDDRYAVEAFYAVKIPFLARWLRRNLDTERPIVIWGAGRTTRVRLRPLLEHGLPIGSWLDIDPKKIGGRADGLPVRGIDALQARPRPFVLSAVRNRGARARVEAHLASIGFAAKRDFLLLS